MMADHLDRGNVRQLRPQQIAKATISGSGAPAGERHAVRNRKHDRLQLGMVHHDPVEAAYRLGVLAFIKTVDHPSTPQDVVGDEQATRI
jgi:hypothetical protein